MEEIKDNRSPEEAALNQAAFNALMGTSADWRADLVALLRSDVPIGPAVRSQLAEAIGGKSEITLNLSGHQETLKRMEGLEARRKWMRDGELAASYVAQHSKVDDAFAAAADELGEDDPYWRRRYYYFKRCRDWMQSARREGKFYLTMDSDELETVWHVASCNQKSDKPTPPSAEEFDDLRLRRIRWLWSMFKDKRNGRLAVNTFVRLIEVLPPPKD